MNGQYILNKAIKTNQAMWKKYNPEVNKNTTTKNYSHHSKNKGFYPNTNNNYNNRQYSYNQFNPSQNSSAYEQPTDNTTNTTNVPPQQVYTQNINVYLQSLYQQHYLNNVYLNQYVINDDNNNITQQFDELRINNYDEKSYDNDVAENSKNPEIFHKTPLDSTTNPEGKK